MVTPCCAEDSMRNPASSSRISCNRLPLPAALPSFLQKPHSAAMASSLAFKSTLLAGGSGGPGFFWPL